MAQQHVLLESLAAVKAVVDKHAVDAQVCVHSLGPEELKQAVQAAYQLIGILFGSFLVPLIGETDKRKLFKHKPFNGASSMVDLIVGWVACTPAFARRLLKLGKHLPTGRFDKTLASLAQGEIDTDQAGAIIDAVRRLPPELVNPDELDKAADTMLDLARGGNDADILKTSGRWLLEHIAPDKAVEHDEKQAERARQRAESMRCMEVTGFGVAGAKEIRFRAESETVEKFMKLIDPLTEPLDPDATGTDGLDQRPLERRRGDAGVELVDHLYATDMMAELSPEQLEHLAAMLRAKRAKAGADHNDDDTNTDNHGDHDTQHDDETQDNDDFGLTNIDDPYDTNDPYNSRDCGDRSDVDDPNDTHQNDQDHQDQPGGVDRSSDCGCDCHHNHDQNDIDDMDSADDDGGSGDQTIDQNDGCDEPDARSEHAKHHPQRRAGSRVRRGKGVWCKPCTHWRPERPKVYIRTDYDHATGRVTAALLDTGERLSVKQVERLMCDSDIIPVWMTKNMSPVAVAATQRYFRGTQLAALIARDFGCCFPGCTRGLRWVHAHHINPYKTTGKTTADDGVLVCSHHHRLLHEGDWTVHIAADGKPEFVPPRWVDSTRTPRRHIRHQR